jgi:hypothetical protein
MTVSITMICLYAGVIMLSFAFYLYFVKCHYAECHFVECRYAECRYAECRYAECCYAKFRYVECRGAVWNGLKYVMDFW